MKIDHISMFATRPEEVKSFYEKYFGAQPEKSFKDEETGLQAYNMVFDDGAKLEIINRPEIQKMMKNHIDLGYIRLGFEMDSREAVDELAQRLEKDGFTIKQKPSGREDGQYDCIILDPDDNQIVLIA